jgi:alkanesulfonate monooxygenase SsuD/methylene tetrahydromethanopterin reductase-like flavin-dependent oxidoreductase (luciferase family)
MKLLHPGGLVGTAEDCARRIVAMAPAGVSNLFVQAFQTFVGPERELRTFRDEVFPRLKAAGHR